jgi:nicotinamidase-related amidase
MLPDPRVPVRAVNAALIVIDVLQTYDFEDVEQLLPSAEAAAPVIARLVREARERDVLTIYVNDNLGDWQHDRKALLERVLGGEHARLVEPVAPPEDALLVTKGRHSVFYETPLALLLREREIGRLVLCGQVTEQCVLYSALDAHVRQFECVIARDACASIDEELAEAAFRMMERNMAAVVVDADEALDRALTS